VGLQTNEVKSDVWGQSESGGLSIERADEHGVCECEDGVESKAAAGVTFVSGVATNNFTGSTGSCGRGHQSEQQPGEHGGLHGAEGQLAEGTEGADITGMVGEHGGLHHPQG